MASRRLSWSLSVKRWGSLAWEGKDGILFWLSGSGRADARIKKGRYRPTRKNSRSIATPAEYARQERPTPPKIWDGMAGPYRPAVTVSGQRGRFRAATRPYEAGGAEDRIASALEHGHAQRPGRYAPGCAGETYV